MLIYFRTLCHTLEPTVVIDVNSIFPPAEIKASLVHHESLKVSPLILSETEIMNKKNSRKYQDSSPYGLQQHSSQQKMVWFKNHTQV